MAAHPETPTLVSSRLLEYGRMALGVDRIEIAPLDPERIRDYLRRYLAALHPNDARAARQQAETLWKSLGGSDELLGFWRKVAEHGEPQRFWQQGRVCPLHTGTLENGSVAGNAGADDRAGEQPIHATHDHRCL